MLFCCHGTTPLIYACQGQRPLTDLWVAEWHFKKVQSLKKRHLRTYSAWNGPWSRLLTALKVVLKCDKCGEKNKEKSLGWSATSAARTSTTRETNYRCFVWKFKKKKKKLQVSPINTFKEQKRTHREQNFLGFVSAFFSRRVWRSSSVATLGLVAVSQLSMAATDWNLPRAEAPAGGGREHEEAVLLLVLVVRNKHR